MRKHALLLSIALSAAGCTTQSAEVAPTIEVPPVPPLMAVVRETEVRDLSALEKLRGNAGLTLQWIDWNKRGLLEVSQRGAVVHLKGAQVAPDSKGRLEIEGDVLSIDANHFIFRGRIAIFETPDVGRSCVKNSDSEFAITQGRKYWRMREFEWCDGLTDYIDIYF